MAHKVSLLVYPDFELLDTTGPSSVFGAANMMLLKAGLAEFYSVEMLSTSGGPVRSSSGVSLHTEALADTPTEGVDTLLVAGALADPMLAILEDPLLRSWVPRCAGAAGRFGSICSGAFILAGLGLVDGKRVATHWDACAPLAAHFPAVTVDPESIFVEDGKVWTSAGVTAGIDMALALVARDLDASIAARVAQWLVLYARRPGYQSQFSPILRAQAKADNPFVELIDWLHANLHRQLDVPSLAERAGLSERTFHRKFQAVTGEPPAHFIESLRLDAARLLLTRGLSLKEVAARVGLSPSSRLGAAFERRFGVSPRLFREMHAVEGRPCA
ncbi:AraC family transcriptional regulator [Devosia insulae DS-56]|uniref:AraC family transcriptional regulator n=1 Tax=Devosia insulae DS-56 TaxID=1116389 RepID=A0A1E5XHE8_9HYPH|nr:helix-turn-helix domain-containing protein [Devosia insulae]OEO28023.1 AraC family transcriptional regulator [Devosia insulae DS-56]